MPDEDEPAPDEGPVAGDLLEAEQAFRNARRRRGLVLGLRFFPRRLLRGGPLMERDAGGTDQGSRQDQQRSFPGGAVRGTKIGHSLLPCSRGGQIDSEAGQWTLSRVSTGSPRNHLRTTGKV